MHGQKLKIFKRLKNPEDGSDFDDFRTKKKRSDTSCLMKKNRTIETNEKFPKFEKLSMLFSKILKIDIADVIH